MFIGESARSPRPGQCIVEGGGSQVMHQMPNIQGFIRHETAEPLGTSSPLPLPSAPTQRSIIPTCRLIAEVAVQLYTPKSVDETMCLGVNVVFRPHPANHSTRLPSSCWKCLEPLTPHLFPLHM